MAWLRRDIKGNEALEAKRIMAETVPRVVHKKAPTPDTQTGKVLAHLRAAEENLTAAKISADLGIAGKFVWVYLDNLRKAGWIEKVSSMPDTWRAIPDIADEYDCVRGERHRTRAETAEALELSGVSVWRRIRWLEETYPMHHEWAKPQWRVRPQRMMPNSGTGKQRKVKLPVPPGFKYEEPKLPEFKVDELDIIESQIREARMLRDVLYRKAIAPERTETAAETDPVQNDDREG